MRRRPSRPPPIAAGRSRSTSTSDYGIKALAIASGLDRSYWRSRQGADPETAAARCLEPGGRNRHDRVVIAVAGEQALIVVVMGVAGSGKTTLGHALASHLRVPFIEGDSHHPKSNVDKMSAGIPLADEDRWPWLDRLGGALAMAAGQQGAVVGACSALRRVYRERLSAAAGRPIRFICLSGNGETISRRMAGRSGHFMPVSLLESQLALLELPGPDESAVVLPLSLPVADLLDRALEWLSRPPESNPAGRST